MDSNGTDFTPQMDGDDDMTAIEPWTDWVKRCTHDVERQFAKLGVDDWITHQRRRKFRWAGRVISDDTSKWTHKALMWDPTLDPKYSAIRRQARPRTRWTDDLMELTTKMMTDATGQRPPDNSDHDDFEMSDGQSWMRVAADLPKKAAA